MNQVQEARTLAERRAAALERLHVRPACIGADAGVEGPAEFSGRTVMRAGVWLDDPVD